MLIVYKHTDYEIKVKKKNEAPEFFYPETPAKKPLVA
jgi:hypothetical protein